MGIELKTSLSSRSQTLIKQYCDWGGDDLPMGTAISTQALIAWLNKDDFALPAGTTKAMKKKMNFLRASLQVSLLTDLAQGIGHSSSSEDQPTKPKAERAKFFAFLATGTFLAAFQGFDSIASILSIFTIPASVTLLAGLAFSIFSIMVFYGFNLVQMAKENGMKLVDARKWLSMHWMQLQIIKNLSNKVMGCSLAKLSAEEASCLEQLLLMLPKRLARVHQCGQQCNAEINSRNMLITKHIFTGISGLLFFCGGFCSGQTASIFLLGLAFSGIGALSWPVLVISVAIGLAALVLYWFVERSSSQKLISSWFGLDEELVDELSDDKVIAAEVKKVEQLQEQLSDCRTLVKRVKDLEANQAPATTSSFATEVASKPASNVRVGNNVHSFHKPRAKSTSALPSFSDVHYQQALYPTIAACP